MDWIIRIVILIAFVPFIMYFVALGKNVRKTERITIEI